MDDEIKGAVAEAVRAVETGLRDADRARVRDLLAAELRRVTGRLDGLAVSLDIAGLSAAVLAPEMTATAIEGHVKDVKARLTEQVRLRVLTEARASDAGAKLAEAEATLQAQGQRFEREKAELCTAAGHDAAAARLQLRDAREAANVAKQECERLQAEVEALQRQAANAYAKELKAAEEADHWEAAAAALSHASNRCRVLMDWDWTDGPPKWGEATITVDFANLCPEYDPGPAATADHVVPQIRLDAFGFVPGETQRTYHIAAAQRPNGAPRRGWGRPVGPRSSEFFVWIDRMDRLPALHIRNAPPSYTPIHALVWAMERRDREAAEEQRDREAAAAKEAAEAEEAEEAAQTEAEIETATAVVEALAAWRLHPALVERLPTHLHNLRLVARKLRVTPPDDYIGQGDSDLCWLIEHGERCGENPAWGEGERQIINVRRCDAAGDIIPSGDFHATRYPVVLLPVVIPA